MLDLLLIQSTTLPRDRPAPVASNTTSELIIPPQTQAPIWILLSNCTLGLRVASSSTDSHVAPDHTHTDSCVRLSPLSSFPRSVPPGTRFKAITQVCPHIQHREGRPMPFLLPVQCCFSKLWVCIRALAFCSLKREHTPLIQNPQSLESCTGKASLFFAPLSSPFPLIFSKRR